MKILLSAYSCGPGLGSEPGVGWNAVQQAARFHSVWVLTQNEGRHGIEAAVASGALPNVRFEFIDFPPWALFWKKGRRGQQLHYYLWQIAAYFAGRRLQQEVGFDIIHHVTFVKYSTPSFLALLPVPFIWGPVGGGESAPFAFWWSFSLRGKLFEFARAAARKMGEYDPFTRHTARRASLGLATTAETEGRMRALGCRNTTILPAIGLPVADRVHLNGFELRRESPFRIVSIGNLLHWKGYHLSVRAFAEFHRQFPESEYWLFGDGHEKKRLEKLAQNLGVAQSVKFWGNVPRREVLEKLADCNALIHPSLHESGGWVCLEAMAAGRPVVCLDLGGPGLQVTERTGIKVKARTPDEAVAGLASAFLRLAQDPELRIRIAEASRKRVNEHFDSAGKGEFMSEIYQSAVARP